MTKDKTVAEEVADVFDTSPVAVAAAVAPTISPVVQEVIKEVDRAANAEYIQVTASKVTPHIGAKARDIIYTTGVVLGVIGTVAPVIAGALTGEWATAVASVGSLALAITNLLAKLNLSKTAEDIKRESK